MLTSLDLFTGIAGITYALEDMFRPVLYCDISPVSQKIISKLIEKENIPPAPIHNDIKTLKIDYPVDAILGGSPCTGFSVIGKRKNLEDPQSILMLDYFRVIRESRAWIAFQENVPGVMNVIDVILKEYRELDMECAWMKISAADLGAPHKRERWFLLAIKRGRAKDLPIQSHPPAMDTTWEKEPSFHTRMTKRSKGGNDRCRALGNTVVPKQLRYAFLTLLHRLQFPEQVEEDVNGKDGIMNADGEIIPIAHHIPTNTGNLQLVLRGDVTLTIPSTSGNRVTSPAVNTRRISRWSTPRYSSCAGASWHLTERSARDIGTQIRFEQNTPDDIRNLAPNPQFIEYLMGYPRDWTSF